MDDDNFQDGYFFGTFLDELEGAESLYGAGSGQTYTGTLPQFEKDVEQAQNHHVRLSLAIVCLPR